MAEEPREVIVEREREPRSSNVGTIVAVVIGVLILLALLIWGLPNLTGGNNSTTDVDVEAPVPTTGTGTAE
ncbi:MAG: hypothetical protein QG649_730 [Patescibacteria group bacterium]|nr:hypothetical protein [Patescibacteria group bacterium]